MKKSLLKPKIEEVFELGRREGLKEALKEILELSKADPMFLAQYIKARLKSIDEFGPLQNPFRDKNEK